MKKEQKNLLQMSGNIITKSNALINASVTLKGMFKEEAFQAVSGIRWDAGEPGNPYVSPFRPNYDFQNDAQRAIWLANLLPPGFHLDPDNTPITVMGTKIHKTTNRDPNYVYFEKYDKPGFIDFIDPNKHHTPNNPNRKYIRKIPKNEYQQNTRGGPIKKEAQ